MYRTDLRWPLQYHLLRPLRRRTERSLILLQALLGYPMMMMMLLLLLTDVVLEESTARQRVQRNRHAGCITLSTVRRPSFVRVSAGPSTLDPISSMTDTARLTSCSFVATVPLSR